MGLYFNIALFLPYKNYENKNVIIKGYVIEKSINNEYILKVDKFDKYKLIKKFKIKIYTNEIFEIGDLLLLNGEFTSGDVARNYKGFNYKKYLRQNGIMGIVNIVLDNKDSGNENNYNNFIKKVGEKKNANVYISILKVNLNDVLESLYEIKYCGFMQSILLGNKTNLENGIKVLFSETFLSHVLAISGMHVGIILNSVKNILNKFCKSYKLNIFFQILFLLFFYLITGMQISCFRTILFNLFMLISKLVYEKSNIAKTAIYSYIILIMVNVYNIINIALYLSFLSSISIILFNKFFDRLIRVNRKRNKKKNESKSKNNELINFILKFIKESIVISISAQILIIPIMIYFFNYFTFKFLITNLVISIFIGIILKVGYICLILGVMNKELFNQINILEILVKIISKCIEVLLSFIFYLLDILNKIKIFDFYIITPSVLFLILYYIVIILLVYKFNKNPYRNFKKIRRIKSVKDINIKKGIKDFIKNKKILIIVLIFVFVCSNVVYYYINKRV